MRNETKFFIGVGHLGDCLWSSKVGPNQPVVVWPQFLARDFSIGCLLNCKTMLNGYATSFPVGNSLLGYIKGSSNFCAYSVTIKGVFCVHVRILHIKCRYAHKKFNGCQRLGL
jgi:hypothetical protein